MGVGSQRLPGIVPTGLVTDVLFTATVFDSDNNINTVTIEFSRASNAPYTVNYDGGSQTVPADQQTNGAQWNLLGTWTFVAGTSGNVQLTNNANGVVIADAVRFQLQPYA